MMKLNLTQLKLGQYIQLSLLVDNTSIVLLIEYMEYSGFFRLYGCYIKYEGSSLGMIRVIGYKMGLVSF